MAASSRTHPSSSCRGDGKRCGRTGSPSTPQTVVLSVNGEEHLNNNPYDNYFESDDTFRGLRVKDKRLGAKEPVYTFRLQDDPYAAPHSSFQGGRLFKIPSDSATTLMLYRERGISFFASSEAYLVDAPASADPREVLTKIRDGRLSSQPLGGFDTFWYSWVTVNPNSKLLRLTPSTRRLASSPLRASRGQGASSP